MKVMSKRTFLVRQEDIDGGKKKDILAFKNKNIDLPEKEVIKFWGNFEWKFTPDERRKLVRIAKEQKLQRVV